VARGNRYPRGGTERKGGGKKGRGEQKNHNVQQGGEANKKQAGVGGDKTNKKKKADLVGKKNRFTQGGGGGGGGGWGWGGNPKFPGPQRQGELR